MLKKIFLLLLILNNLLVYYPVLASSPDDLVFTEIMYDPEGSDSSREWVEIYNKGSEPVTIITGSGENSWRFNDGGNHLISLFQGSEVIGPGEFVILAADGQVFLSEHPDFTGSIFDTTMGLNNTLETIKLSADGGQSFFTEITYDSSWGAAGNGRTLEKIDFIGSNERENWQESFIIGGTPGQISSLEPPNQPPIAEAGLDQIVNSGALVLFDGTGSSDPGNDQLSYLWDFGDNQAGEGVTTTHAYYATGTYVVILTVSDGQLTDQDDLSVTVNEPVNQPPVAAAGPDLSGFTNQPVYFSAAGSFDPDGDVLTYNWNFGDNQTADGLYVNHNYQSSGNFTVTLTVSDSQLSVTDILLVSISNEDPGQGGSSIDYSLIYLNELLPNPAGSDEAEWLELYNDSQTPIDLNGLKIQDNSAASYQIDGEDFLSTTINAKGYFIIERAVSGLALNNTGGDCLRILSPTNIIIKILCYSEQTPEGQSYARKNDNSWQWTEIPTKNSQNQFSVSSANNLTENEEDAPANIIEYLNQAEFNEIFISELLPNPPGSDNGEFIELFNQSTSSINLTNWSLDDQPGGSAPFKINENKIIPPFSYMVFNKTDSKISLNNTSDQVRLITPSGQIVREIDYENPPEGKSYNYNLSDDEWYWSTTTPGETNIITEIQAPINELSDNNIKANDYEQNILTISQVRQLEKGESVITVGLVTALPGSLGNNVFYLAEVDNNTREINLTAGLQIYNYKKDFPDLKIGDVLEISGEISENQGEKRLKIKNRQAINLLDNFIIPLPPEVGLEEVSEDLTGGLVTVNGEISEKSGNTIMLSDAENELAVYIKDKNIIDFSQLKTGYQLKVIGIVGKTKDGYRLMPRMKSDLSLGTIIADETTGKEIIADIKTEKIATTSKDKVRNTLLACLGGLTVSGIALFIKAKFIG